MRRFACRGWPVLVATGLVVSILHGGDGRIDPEKPRAGQEIVLTYRIEPGQPGLPPAAEAYVLVRSISGGVEQRTTVPLGPLEDGARTARFRVLDGTSFLRFSFVNRWADDPDAEIRVKIWADDERPVRGAWLAEANAIFPGECDAQDRCDYDAPLDKELELYPNNLGVQVSRWWRDRLHRQKSLSERMDEVIAGLSEESEDDSADLIRVRLTGALLNGRIPLAGAQFVRLLQLHPDSPITYLAAGEVVRASMMWRGAPGVDEASLGAIAEHVTLHPSDPVSRHLVSLAKDRLSLQTLDAVYSAWMEDEPREPEPATLLAMALEERDGSTERILELTELATDWMVSGETRIRADPGGWAARRYLPLLQKMRARLLLEQGATTPAVGAARLAAEYQAEGVGAAEMLEAQIWRQVGRLDLAEEALVEAMGEGDPAEARGELKSIYRVTHGDLDGFESHLAALEQRLAPDCPGAIDPAEFLGELSWKTLDGEELAPDAWKGKVVAVNFWALACAPCVEEIPGLNGLVKEFGDREDVLFVAPTPDDPELLRLLLKSTPFHYRIVPGDEDWQEAFQVNGWPTHLIIDRDGEVVLRRMGAKDIVSHLEKELDRLLR